MGGAATQPDIITIDGSQGEGGGQILRTSLSLSMVTGRPFRITRIRAGRQKPGLLRQHLTCVQAAASVCSGQVVGAELRSQEITFTPGIVQPGKYHFSVGTAGSATLVCQTVLPTLLTASEPSTLSFEGGTHNPMAPPFEYLADVLFPLLERMGPGLSAKLERRGFAPAGGGRFVVQVTPAQELKHLELHERGNIVGKRAIAMIAGGLAERIGERELKMLSKKLTFRDDELVIENDRTSRGPGNIVAIRFQCEHVTEIFHGFGEIGLKAENVASRALEEARQWLACGAPVGRHLADQLMLPMALSGGGSFTSTAPSRHSSTNARIIGMFLPVVINITSKGDDKWLYEVKES